jgi:nicotinamidase-related amidase
MKFQHAVLLLVDIQPDFMPGGALAVAGGDEMLQQQLVNRGVVCATIEELQR